MICYTGDGWQSSLENQTRGRALPQPPADGSRAFAVRPGLDAGRSGRAGAARAADRDLPGSRRHQPILLCRRPAPDRVWTLRSIGRCGCARVCARWPAGPGRPRRGPVPYAVISQPAPDPMQPEVQARLRRAGTDYPPECVRLYLPSRRQRRHAARRLGLLSVRPWRRRVQALPPDRRDPLDEALALRAWVAGRCVYSLAVPPIPAEPTMSMPFSATPGAATATCSRLPWRFSAARRASLPASRPASRLATRTATASTCAARTSMPGRKCISRMRAGWLLTRRQGRVTDGTVPNAQNAAFGRAGCPGCASSPGRGLGVCLAPARRHCADLSAMS